MKTDIIWYHVKPMHYKQETVGYVIINQEGEEVTILLPLLLTLDRSNDVQDTRNEGGQI